ncbi:ubiquitin carboxyl-terminal hydrolase 17 2, putative [Babesia ovis]|uniref:Ubiquitin carboxyl-terminal hydrolase 17 2, putative n=1 Tax=Babesia ovis TaxID=5869 RepID=A0A9W5TED3_BABOV|nr:ubiquitin carboxyl-terminal hydrolase 17 2, putative [Babesia ovis]
MDPRELMPRNAPDLGDIMRREEMVWSNSIPEQYLMMEPNEHMTDRWPIPTMQNIEHNMRMRNVQRSNGCGDYEQDPNAMEAARMRLGSIMAERREFVGTEGWQYGLEGLIDALESYPMTQPPIVTAEGIDREQLGKRLLGK